MAVLPDTVSGGNGILGGRFAQRRPRIANAIRSNPSALLNFGLGMLSGSTRSEAWSNAQQGMAYGAQADLARRERTQQEEEQARQEEARNNLFMSPDFQSLSGEDRAWLMANPDAADQFIASNIQNRMTPATAAPPELEDFWNPETGQIERRAWINGQWTTQGLGAPDSPLVTVDNRGSDGINYGNPENGYAWARNPDGTVKIDERGAPIALPTGSALAAQQEAEAAAARGAADEGVIADAFVDTIDRAIGLAGNADGGLPTTGLIGNLLAGVPMPTQARELANELQTIKSRTSLEEINRMRQNSPTGAALGNATNADMTRLESAIVTLDQAVGTPALTAALQRLQEAYLDLVHGAGNWTRDTTGNVVVGRSAVNLRSGSAAGATPAPAPAAPAPAATANPPPTTPPPPGVTNDEWRAMTEAERALF